MTKLRVLIFLEGGLKILKPVKIGFISILGFYLVSPPTREETFFNLFPRTMEVSALKKTPIQIGSPVVEKLDAPLCTYIREEHIIASDDHHCAQRRRIFSKQIYYHVKRTHSDN